MLIPIKRQSFKISSSQFAQELGIREGLEGFEVEVSSRQTPWIFRYDCIVPFNNPNLALTLDSTT
jgi:hypothetical protein